MVSNPKKFFKKNFSRFRSNNNPKSDNVGNELKGSNSSSEKTKSDRYKGYQ